MGTLYHQRPRTETLHSYMHSISRALEFMKVPTNRKPTPAEWHAACDMVRTALAIQSADALDEQLCGFGLILDRIASALADLS
jgi:hypothetical protein